MKALDCVVNAGELLGNAGMVIVIGLVVVFSTLIVLTLIFWLFGQVMDQSKKAKPAKPTVKETPKMATAPAPIPAAPVVENNSVSDEVVAVIAAAVAAMTPEGKKYTVRSVSHVRGNRPVWASAGLAESTRPF